MKDDRDERGGRRMTIQELINQLQYSIELGFDPNAAVMVDFVDDKTGYSQHALGDVDYHGTNMGILPLNVYANEEDEE